MAKRPLFPNHNKNRTALILLATVVACMITVLFGNVRQSMSLLMKSSSASYNTEYYQQHHPNEHGIIVTSNKINKDESKQHTSSSSLSSSLPIMDVLSVGSIYRTELQDAQRKTFGSHPSVRYFYSATEYDDTELSCHTNLTMNHLRQIVLYCHGLSDSKKKKNKGRQQQQPQPTLLSQKLTPNFARGAWLSKKKNPMGWMCAQKRPINAMMNYMKLLRRMTRTTHHDTSLSTTTATTTATNMTTKTTAELLPDYLWIIDDDTWINLDNVIPFLTEQQASEAPHAVAGCMIRSRIKVHNFTIPYGGFGLLLNRRLVENFFFRPLHCTQRQRQQQQRDSNDDDEFQTLACWRLTQNLIGERPLFHDGMSIAELVSSYVDDSPYLDAFRWGKPMTKTPTMKNSSGNSHRNTTSSSNLERIRLGFCMHSDWVWGYFINYYHLAVHQPVVGESGDDDRHHRTNNVYADVLHNRLEGYNHSELYAGDPSSKHERNRAKLRQCLNGNDARCTSSAHVCHRISPAHMRWLYQQRMTTT